MRTPTEIKWWSTLHFPTTKNSTSTAAKKCIGLLLKNFFFSVHPKWWKLQFKCKNFPLFFLLFLAFQMIDFECVCTHKRSKWRCIKIQKVRLEKGPSFLFRLLFWQWQTFRWMTWEKVWLHFFEVRKVRRKAVLRAVHRRHFQRKTKKKQKKEGERSFSRLQYLTYLQAD